VDKPPAEQEPALPERVREILAIAGFDLARLAPVEHFEDGWDRYKIVDHWPLPVPSVTNRDMCRFVGMHATDEQSLGLIMGEFPERLRAGPASDGPYIYCRGSMMDERSEPEAKKANKESILQVLSGFRNGVAAKHMSGVVIEITMYGEHKACRTQGEEADFASRGGHFTSRRIHNGTQWCVPESDATVRALWVDRHWAYSADPLQ
jgi:hypothetical protein